MIRSQSEIYERLEEVFVKITEPMTCVDLMEIPAIRKAATERWGSDVQYATEKLSDTLGFMWKRDMLNRFSAPPNPRNKARWAYAKKNAPVSAEPIPYDPGTHTKNKGTLEIIEKEGEVVLNFEKFTVVIRPK